jgi:hypothetical protein
VQEASEDGEDDEEDKELERTLGLTLSLWLVVLGLGRIVHGRVLVLAGIIRLWPWRVDFLLGRADRGHRRS